VDKFIFGYTRTESMLIRQYRKGDESGIASVYNSAFREEIDTLPEIYKCKEVSTRDIHMWLEDGATLWVAELEERIVGYAHVRVIIEEGMREIPTLQITSPRKWTLEQSNIAIDSEYQRRGIGTQLLNGIIERYKDSIEFIFVLTFSDNKMAEKFFEKNGFRQHDAYYFPDFSEDYPMMNSSVYEVLELNDLKAPKNLNENIIFRRATLEDAAAVTKIHRQNVWWSEESNSIEWNLDYIEGRFGHTVFVAELKNEVVGVIDHYTDERVGIAGVLPHMTGKGIGSAMFYNILRTMKDAGFKYAFMDSGMTQEEAIRMYERFGFKIQRKQNAWIRRLR